MLKFNFSGNALFHRARRFFSTALAGFALFGFIFSAAPALAASYDDALNAARLGDTGSLVDLLKRGLDPDTVDPQGNTLLILAAREGNAETAAALLKYRAKANYRNSAGDSALMLAVLRGHDKVVEALLAGGAQVNNEGWAPLHYAAFEGRAGLVDRLLAAGADPKALAPNQANALMLAARNGHIDVVRRLLKTDIDLDQRNDAGLTADDWALTTANTDVADLIRNERIRRGGKPPQLRIEIE